jgi:hypothetical protein
MSFLVFLIALAVSIWPFRWVLGPVERAAKERGGSVQFNLADVLSLFVLIQLALGAVHWKPLEMRLGAMIVFDALLAGIVALIWWAYVRILSEAGIHVIWPRCVILVAALPIATAAGLATLFLPFAVLDLFRSRDVAWHDAGVLTGAIVLGTVAYGLGHVTRAIVASAAKE